MTDVLRPYQRTDIERIRTALATQTNVPGDSELPPSVMYQLPTGGGKTRVGAEIVNTFVGPTRKVLWLTHRGELADQAEQELTRRLPRRTTIRRVDRFRKGTAPTADVWIAMVQTYHRRLNQVSAAPDLIVIDEAHHARASTYEAVLHKFPNATRLGLTATPARLDGRGFDDLYQELICGPDIPTLQGQGYLAEVRMFATDQMYDIRKLREKHGDYAISSMKAEYLANMIHFDTAPLDAYTNYGNDRQAILFTPLVKHACNCAKKFREVNIPAEVIHANQSQGQRDSRIMRFRRGETKVLCNCEIVGEGFDVPQCDCIILARPTKSLTIFLQQCGRGSRPHDGEPALILDCVGNHIRHGHAAAPRSWWLDGQPAPVPQAWECRNCHAIVPAELEICPYCETRKPKGSSPPPKQMPAGDTDKMLELPGPVITRERLSAEELAYADGLQKLLEANAKGEIMEEMQNLGHDTMISDAQAMLAMLRQKDRSQMANFVSFITTRANTDRTPGATLPARLEATIASDRRPQWNQDLRELLEAELASPLTRQEDNA